MLIVLVKYYQSEFLLNEYIAHLKLFKLILLLNFNEKSIY